MPTTNVPKHSKPPSPLIAALARDEYAGGGQPQAQPDAGDGLRGVVVIHVGVRAPEDLSHAAKHRDHDGRTTPEQHLVAIPVLRRKPQPWRRRLRDPRLRLREGADCWRRWGGRRRVCPDTMAGTSTSSPISAVESKSLSIIARCCRTFRRLWQPPLTTRGSNEYKRDDGETGVSAVC